MTERPIIAGTALIEWLIAQGVIEDGPITRIRIDAPFDGPIEIVVWKLGDDRLVEADVPQVLAEADVEVRVRIPFVGTMTNAPETENMVDPDALAQAVIQGEAVLERLTADGR